MRTLFDKASWLLLLSLLGSGGASVIGIYFVQDDAASWITGLRVVFIVLIALSVIDILSVVFASESGATDSRLSQVVLPAIGVFGFITRGATILGSVIALYPLNTPTGTTRDYVESLFLLVLSVTLIGSLLLLVAVIGSWLDEEKANRALSRSRRQSSMREQAPRRPVTAQQPTTEMRGLTWGPPTYETTIEDFRHRRITGEVAKLRLHERYEWLLKDPDSNPELLKANFERSKGQLEQLIEEQQPAQAGQERDNTSPPPLRTQTLAGLRQVSQREPEQAPPNEELPRLRRRDPEMPVMTFEQTLAAFERDEIDWYAAFAQMNRYNVRRVAEGVNPSEIIRAYSEAMRRLAEADRRKNGSAGERAQGAFGRIREDQIQRARESWMPPKREDPEREPNTNWPYDDALAEFATGKASFGETTERIHKRYAWLQARPYDQDEETLAADFEAAKGELGRIVEEQRSEAQAEPAPTIYDPQTIIDLYNGDQMTFEEANEAISRWVGQHPISRIQSGRNAVQELEALRQRREDDQARVQTPPSGDDIESTGDKAGEGDSR